MTEEKLTAYQWRRRAEKAEAKYQKLRDEINLIRSRDFAETIELCDHRCVSDQVRKLLLESIQMIDSIRDSEIESEQLYKAAM